MLEILGNWFRRHFSHPQAVFLAVVLILGLVVILTLGRMLAPLLAAVVIAYLLEGLVAALERRGASRSWVVWIVFMVFMAFVAFLMLAVTPILWTQLKELLLELPQYIAQGQRALMELPEEYAFITQEQVSEVMALVRGEMAELGQRIVSISLASIPGVITLVIYLVLVPLLVFFLLKDKTQILNWATSFLPTEHGVASRIWAEVDVQLGNYVRGKFWEILIVGVVSFAVFALMGLKYSLLLAVLVGLSVIIPYIGATVVTVPVALVAYFQFGWGAQFAYLMLFYFIIQLLDGNVLVPLLFSEVVNLHPIAIIVSVLVFGGLWGFWGVFFAIPLATVINVLINAWPAQPQAPEDPGAGPAPGTPV